MLSRYQKYFRDVLGAMLLFQLAVHAPVNLAANPAAPPETSGAGAATVCGERAWDCATLGGISALNGAASTLHPNCLAGQVPSTQTPLICRSVSLFEALNADAAKPKTRVVDLNYELEINKTQRTLVLKNRDKVEKKYLIATGRGGPGDKRVINDKKTPVGTYRIVQVKEQSAFYSFLQLNYPNVKDAFFGLKDNIISRTEFDRIVSAVKHHAIPPQNTRLGGAIGIHGIGRVTPHKLNLHSNLDWTKGCIALTNEQLDEIMQHVGVGTKVVINE